MRMDILVWNPKSYICTLQLIFFTVITALNKKNYSNLSDFTKFDEKTQTTTLRYQRHHSKKDKYQVWSYINIVSLNAYEIWFETVEHSKRQRIINQDK